MITKQAINISMGQGLDLKTDPKQISIGKYLSLQNTIFQKGGLLQKRNGYGSLPSLPDTSYSYLTTFNGNLTAIGNKLNAYSSGAQQWKPTAQALPIQPVDVSTLSLIRSNLDQSQCDTAISSNNLICTVYTDNGGPITPQYKYAVADVTTGQNIISPTVLVATGQGRVFFLGNYFVIIYSNGANLNYVAVNIYTLVANAPVTISSLYTSSLFMSFDGFVASGNLYIAWAGIGGDIRVTYINSVLTQFATIVYPAVSNVSYMSVCADTTQATPIIYVSFYYRISSNGFILAVDSALNHIFNPTALIVGELVQNITMSAQNGVCKVFYEINNTYAYDITINTFFIKTCNVTQAGVVGPKTVLLRSVGLASKSFILNGTIYVLTTYSSPYQPSYFLIDSIGNVIAKTAYSNGGGYLTHGLPAPTVSGTTASIAYLITDTLQAANKTQIVKNAAGTTISPQPPFYTQTGVNLANYNITTSDLTTSEIGANLNLTGGFLWAYDGYSIAEQNFFLWPDSVEATWSAAGGAMAAKPDGATNTNAYYYQVTYEWTDNQGNLFRSAPSVPVAVTTTGAGNTGSVTLHIPTLRLTYKIANPVKIVIYRWSVAQQVYYQVTSIASPTLNDTTIDAITYVDTLADASIVGNNIIYTTGGVVEDIGPPACSALALFKSRLFLVDAEDRNLLWYSKQVIEATPVEMSDAFTIYVAPTTSTSANTGPMTALSAMDDKLIIFKKDAIYYITGNGPDNTGANNDFSDPIFVTSTVGCANPFSIVFMPNGLMFQSDKGIWLLGRDLSTSYIGAPVEDFNQYIVQSAVNIPATNQVRFTLSNGVTLMYDYFYGQWGTFTGVPAISSCIYQGLHSFINQYGATFQETPGIYLDGSNPVLISFTTGWINPAGLQGYLRSIWFFILGKYLSPHKLQVSIAYDYNDSPTQNTTISPTNFSPAYGLSSPYGYGSPYAGPPNLERWKVHLTKQLCLAFQIGITEIYDPSFGVPAGAGLTISGLDLVVALKSGWAPIPGANSAGSH